MLPPAMPITFKSKSSPDIVMLEGVALELIRLLGHSATVPGALMAEDLPQALANLRAGLAMAPALAADRERETDDEERTPEVSSAHRALPLIAMLEGAIAEGDHVIWDR
jgi:hypothetical protein